MTRALRLAVLLVGLWPGVAAATPPAWEPGAVPDDLAELVRASRTLPLPERVEAISRWMLGRPYVLDPAGEGEPPDPDPPGRYDAFDCLTFVEEVSALALAADPAGAGAIRHSLRYGDHEPTYAHRHHFMELQWIPWALSQGWLRDTTAEYAEVVHRSREVDGATWERWRGRARFALTAEQLPLGTMELDVIPLDAARRVASTLRPGSLVMAVRVDVPTVPLWITHVGFVVPGPDGPHLRHATRMSSSVRVRDNALAWYLDHLATYTSWPVWGIAVFELQEQGPRASR